jgi:DNA-binding response OmpR family regulator
MADKVLIADPDVTLLASYRAYLSRHGFQVATARDGLECVARLRAFRPDIVVLSPHLLWGAGEGVLAMMYEERDVPLVPVLALDDDYREDGRYLIGPFPVRGYHVKPLAPALLAASLAQALQKHRASLPN